MTAQDIKSQIRLYLSENFVLGTATVLTDDESLLESQLLDSTGFLELVAFIEERFCIRVADDEMMPENLETIDNIARYVEQKQRG